MTRIGLALAGVLLVACASDDQAAFADGSCPSRVESASNGARLIGCAPAPTNAVQAAGPAPGASCPTADDERVRDIVIASVALGDKPIAARVFLPKSFRAQPDRRWPVLYLLSGHGTSYEAWSCATQARAFVEGLELLVVMPEGTLGYRNDGNYTPDGLSGLGNSASGVPAWYADWLDDTVSFTKDTDFAPTTQMRLRTYELVELRELLNRNFRADNARYAVAGLSMGGFGAISYALTSSPERPFVAAASFSGLLDTQLTFDDVPLLQNLDAATVIRGSIQLGQASQGELFGTADRLWGPVTSRSWQDNNPRQQVSKPSALSAMPLYLSAGQGDSLAAVDLDARMRAGSFDPVEAGTYFALRSFVAALARTDAQLTVELQPAGGHNWPHWNVNLCRALATTLLPALGEQASDIASCPTL